jgi:hypothetical protein
MTQRLFLLLSYKPRLFAIAQAPPGCRPLQAELHSAMHARSDPKGPQLRKQSCQHDLELEDRSLSLESTRMNELYCKSLSNTSAESSLFDMRIRKVQFRCYLPASALPIGASTKCPEFYATDPQPLLSQFTRTSQAGGSHSSMILSLHFTVSMGQTMLKVGVFDAMGRGRGSLCINMEFAWNGGTDIAHRNI